MQLLISNTKAKTMKKKLALVCYCFVWSIPMIFGQLKPNDKSAGIQDPKTIFQSYLSIAKNGDAKAMLIIGEFYRTGYGVNQNTNEAFNWYKKAAEAGNGRGWYQMGMIYKYGKGKQIDYKKAYDCFIRSGEMGTPLGTYSQGYMLYKGLGCTQNYEKAFNLFIKASEAKVHESMYFLGLCYRNGYGTKQNETLGIYWLKQAAQRGDQQAVSELKSKIPENTNEAGVLAEKIKSAEKINQKQGITIRKYFNEEHDANLKETDIIGNYTGYLLKYDWSGKYVISASKLSFLIQKGQTRLTGIWTEDENIPLNIKMNLSGGALEFNNAEYKKADHYNYNKIAAKLLYDRAKIRISKNADSTFLSGDIKVFASEKKEPEKPQRIILVKTNRKQENAQTVAKYSTTGENSNNVSAKLQAFPNPFIGVVNLAFTIEENTTVKANVYDETGKLVYTGSPTKLLKGTHKLLLHLQIPSGIYIVKLFCGATEVRISKIVKE